MAEVCTPTSLFLMNRTATPVNSCPVLPTLNKKVYDFDGMGSVKSHVDMNSQY